MPRAVKSSSHPPDKPSQLRLVSDPNRRTFADLVVAFEAWQARRSSQKRLAVSTLASTRSRLRSCVTPYLGRAELRSWGLQEAEEWHARITLDHGPVAANRSAELLRAAWMLAERWGWLPAGSSPFRFLRSFRNPEQPRRRTLTGAELAKLYAELDRFEADRKTLPTQRLAVLGIRLILETGMRREEAFGLRWAQVDLEARRLELGEHKTSRTAGAKRVMLSEEAVAILARIPRGAGETRVFPRANPRSVWPKLRAAIGAPDATIHDLRRTFSSRLAEAGVPAEDVAALLGQRTVRVQTDHYRVLGADRLRELANRGADALRTRKE